MCGVSVLLATNGAPADMETVQRMSDALAHRGPDDSGILVSGQVGLGFRRLSIIDLSPTGHQPMATPDGEAVIVFNGEIYNYLELRDELKLLGHSFRSSSDTEVLLRAYLQWGSDCLSKLNGMWAFVIYDKRRGILFGSRDRFGIKPLYRYKDRDYVLLASEIKSIRASGLYRSKTNWGRAARFLLHGQLDETAQTFYEDIEQVLPGTAFELDLKGNMREWRYWSLEDASYEVGSDPANSFAELFEDAVRLHMRSDVPVGVHLSGGLDSTSIICASARLRRKANANGALMAFSYIAPEFDETRYIADTIEQTGATLIRLETDPLRLWDVLREVLWFQDEPIYSMMPLVSYELMRLAANNGIKVILNGQGADETVAGYPSYFRDYWCTLLGNGEIGHAWKEIGDYVTAQGGHRPRIFTRQLRRLAQSRLGSVSAYRGFAHWWRRRQNLNHRWFTRQLTEQLQEDGSLAPVRLNDSLTYSVYHYPLPQILRVEDRNSMAHSIEARLPFLDYRLVSLVFRSAPNWRMRGPWNKFILRQAMRERIPESVRTRVDKMGFPVPANKWVAGPLHQPILDLLTSRQTRERGIYNVDRIIRDVEKNRSSTEMGLGGAIFDVAQFEAWSAL